MGIEIERKFLVAGRGWRRGKGVRCIQGYISRNRRHVVRVRIAGNRAFLTIKGPPVGISRHEFEYPIPVADARRLLKMSETPLVDKIRRLVRHRGITWEIDEFLGANAGLVVAEVELRSPGQKLDYPAWLGREVTSDPRYANSNLAVRPFRVWRHKATIPRCSEIQ
jgi:adenylate cyclase